MLASGSGLPVARPMDSIDAGSGRSLAAPAIVEAWRARAAAGPADRARRAAAQCTLDVRGAGRLARTRLARGSVGGSGASACPRAASPLAGLVGAVDLWELPSSQRRYGAPGRKR